ncbi:MAG: hypothetical protein U0746_01090 [Gemmataceae bacterium]
MRTLVAIVILAICERSIAQAPPSFPFWPEDRVAWVGSSSTRIGVWPKTVEFLLRTRHPELRLTFSRHSTGGGTFATGLENLTLWLDQSQPTVVLFNYGSNDAAAGDTGIDRFHANVEACVAKAQDRWARVLFTSPQAADTRKSGIEAATRRERYANDLLAFGRSKGWTVYDVFHPLSTLQAAGRADDDGYTILKDTIHLTDPAYIAWGYFLYERFNPPSCDCHAEVTADGRITAMTRCKLTDVSATDGVLRFTRHDEILPLVPPVPLPPRRHVPLERLSPYRLTVKGLQAGRYTVTCDGKLVGEVHSDALAVGVNLNTLALDANLSPPWHTLATRLWDGKDIDQVGKTALAFEIRRK